MKRVFAFLPALLLLTSILHAQTTVSLGTGKIIDSVTGLSSASPNVSGLSAGISFDLTITATSVATPVLTVTNHNDGIGVSGGSAVEIDNRNNLIADDDESLVFTLSNVTGLAVGQSLRISGIGTRSIGTTEKQYAVFDGTTSVSSGSFNTTPFAISVPNLASVKITAVGPTSGAALNSRFIINQLLLTVTGGGGVLPGGGNAAAKVTNAGIDGSGHPFFTFDSIAGESSEIQSSTDLLSWTPLATLSGTGGSITYTDEFTHAPSVPRKFYRAKTVLTPNGNLANTTLSITQTWAQQPGGYARTAVVQVPAGAGPHPVIILLHGNGGTGAGTIGALNPHVSENRKIT
jgi:hypothetical protein